MPSPNKYPVYPDLVGRSCILLASSVVELASSSVMSDVVRAGLPSLSTSNV